MFEDFYTNYFSEFEAELENKELISKVFATKPIDPARNEDGLYEIRLSFNGLTENMKDIMVLYYDSTSGTFFLESPTIVDLNTKEIEIQFENTNIIACFVANA